MLVIIDYNFVLIYKDIISIEERSNVKFDHRDGPNIIYNKVYFFQNRFLISLKEFEIFVWSKIIQRVM